MVINLIVAAITLLMVGFVLAWYWFPRLREWIEAPKYRVLEWAEKYPDAVRDARSDS
jgi:hypothetical protein